MDNLNILEAKLFTESRIRIAKYFNHKKAAKVEIKPKGERQKRQKKRVTERRIVNNPSINIFSSLGFKKGYTCNCIKVIYKVKDKLFKNVLVKKIFSSSVMISFHSSCLKKFLNPR